MLEHVGTGWNRLDKAGDASESCSLSPPASRSRSISLSRSGQRRYQREKCVCVCVCVCDTRESFWNSPPAAPLCPLRCICARCQSVCVGGCMREKKRETERDRQTERETERSLRFLTPTIDGHMRGACPAGRPCVLSIRVKPLDSWQASFRIVSSLPVQRSGKRRRVVRDPAKIWENKLESGGGRRAVRHPVQSGGSRVERVD